MKHYLLTWYGITDLKAALGCEELNGPVLSALQTGDFTDVVVLSYTDPGKIGEEWETRQREMEGLLNRIRSDQRTLTRQEQFEIIDAFANTPAAHRLFKNWLRSETQKLPFPVTVGLCVKELAILNDSKGIFDAVTLALDLVAKEPGEKRITFYLSPGTPVMAFTWAFVALANPELDIQILSSSEPRKPPVAVALPYDLLAPSNRRLKEFAKGEAPGFDVVFHLFGEQRMAPLLGVMQFPARQHIFVTSDQYSAESMKRFMPEGAWGELSVNPFDPMSAKIQILQAVAALPTNTRVGFNLTGGTKLMFAGAIAACRKIGGVPFYFETREHSLIFLHDFSRMEMRSIDNVDVFFQANGFAVLNQGQWADNPCRRQRKPLTFRLWKDRALIAKVYKKIAIYADYNGDQFIAFNFREKIYYRGDEVPIEIDLDQTGRTYLNLGGAEFRYANCPDFAKYLAGKWLEEYAYLILEPLLIEGKIRDLRIGLEVNWDSSNDGHDASPIQEFDIAFTDGKRLFLGECKAGALFSEDVYKLQHCVRNYGGVDARGIMMCAFPPHHPQTRKRLERTSNLAALYGWDIANVLPDLVLRG